MRSQLISWVKDCKQELLIHFRDNVDAQILLDSFISEYFVYAQVLAGNNAFQFRKEYLKSKALNYFNNFSKKKSDSVSWKLGDSIQNEPVDIFFWCYQVVNLGSFHRVYESCRQEKDLSIAVFCNNEYYKSLVRKDFPDMVSFLPPQKSDYSYKEDSLCLQILKAAKTLKPYRYEHINISFYQIVKYMFDSKYWLFKSTLEIYQSVLKRFSPKSFFLRNELNLPTRVVKNLAKRDAIPTFSVMHGTLNMDLCDHYEIDTFFLFGEKDKKRLIKEGMQEEQLVVSGCPVLENKLKQLKLKRLPLESKRILVASSGPGHSITYDHHNKTLEALNLACRKFNDIEFIFKLHPKDQVHYYKAFKDLENVKIITRDNTEVSHDIFDWIANVNIVITGASTAALDSIVMGVPVITIDLVGDLKDVDFIKAGATFHSTDSDSLMHHIDIIRFGGEQVKKILQQAHEFSTNAYAFPQEGSTSFITNYLKNAISQCVE